MCEPNLKWKWVMQQRNDPKLSTKEWLCKNKVHVFGVVMKSLVLNPTETLRMALNEIYIEEITSQS